MLPLVGGEPAGLHNLFAATVLDAEPQRAAARTWCEEQKMGRAVAKVEDALPVGAAVPVNPAGEGKCIAARDVGRQGHDGIRAVEHERLPGVAVGVGRTAGGDAVIAVARGIERVGLKTELSET